MLPGRLVAWSLSAAAAPLAPTARLAVTALVQPSPSLTPALHSAALRGTPASFPYSFSLLSLPPALQLSQRSHGLPPPQVPPHCVPIHANVTTYNWSRLAETTQFDVIMMDPPWQLATANPTRGVALGYSQLTDKDIQNLPIPRLQRNGLLFVWVINAKYQFCLDLFDRWGYT